MWAGVGVRVDEVYGIGPSFYNFCHHRDFGARVLYSILLARAWNTTIMAQTVNITNITYNRTSKVVYCGGPSYERMSKASSSPIAALQLERHTSPKGPEVAHHAPLPKGIIVGSTLAIVAPKFNPVGKGHPASPKPGKMIPKTETNLGWHGAGNPKEADALHQKMEAEGAKFKPKDNHAKPIAQKDMLVLPPKTGQLSKPVIAPQPTLQPVASRDGVQGGPMKTGGIPDQSTITPILPQPQVVQKQPVQSNTPSHNPSIPPNQQATGPTQMQRDPNPRQQQQGNAEGQAHQQALAQQERLATERRNQEQLLAQQQRARQQQQLLIQQQQQAAAEANRLRTATAEQQRMQTQQQQAAVAEQQRRAAQSQQVFNAQPTRQQVPQQMQTNVQPRPQPQPVVQAPTRVQPAQPTSKPTDPDDKKKRR